MSSTREDNLGRFGFRFGRGGAHLARSMMLDDLRRLFEQVPDAKAGRDDFAHAILDDNCLGKRSARTRSLTLRHLTNLYALDPAVPVFRALRYFWQRDSEGQALLACLVAYRLADDHATPPTSSSYGLVPHLLLAGAYPGDPDPDEHGAKVRALLDAGTRKSS